MDHHHHQQILRQQQHDSLMMMMSNNSERVIMNPQSQWSVEETKELIGIRGDMDQNFIETKRNKQLWLLISNAMKLKGYHRTPDQCKCKWKNLVTRFKGYDAGEGESILKQQFPYYTEIQGIFKARIIERMMAEGCGDRSSKKKTTSITVSSSEEEEGEEEMAMMSMEEGLEDEKISKKRRRKGKMVNNKSSSGSSSNMIKVKEIMEEFMRQQMEMEREWMEAYEARERERKEREREWRERMEALESERMMMDERWREREEERRVRQEARAQNRDALITALLNKLSQHNSTFIN